MFDQEVYFDSFLREMRFYLTQLRAAAQVIASPMRADETALDAVKVLWHMGHTIIGLASTLALPDFAVLGEGLEDVSKRIPYPSIHLPALAIPLTSFIAYLEVRLDMMASTGRFIAPDAAEVRAAQHITHSLLQALPTSGVPEPMELLTPMEAEELVHFDQFKQSLPPEFLPFVEEFLAADLQYGDESAPPAQMPLLDERAMQDATFHVFIGEITDGLEQLRANLLRLHDVRTERERQEHLQSMKGIAHNLKGAASVVNMGTTSEIAHKMEDILKALQQQRLSLDEDAFQWLATCIDTLTLLHNRMIKTQQEGDVAGLVTNLQTTFAALQARITGEISDVSSPVRVETLRSADTSSLLKQNQIRIDITRIDHLMYAMSRMLLNRIDTRRFLADALASEAELTMVIARAGALVEDLRDEHETPHLTASGTTTIARDSTTPRGSVQTGVPPLFRRQHDPEVAAASPPDIERFSDFAVLMQRMAEIIADLRALHLGLQTALNRLGRQEEQQSLLSDTLERDVLRLRMVSLREMEPALNWVAIQTARKEAKEVAFTLENGAIEIDRDLSEALGEHLEQMVRNAVVHGIERPDVRQEAGKARVGQVIIRAAYEEGDVIIEVADDGRGIKEEALRIEAQIMGDTMGHAYSADQVRALSQDEVYDLMFQPGISTERENKRDMGGEGTGLSQARTIVEALGGNITVRSTPYVETVFQIRLPVTLSILKTLPVTMGTNVYVVPLQTIERTAAVDPAQIILNEEGIAQLAVPTLDGDMPMPLLPVITLPDLMEHSVPLSIGKCALVVMVHNKEYAILVDSIGEMQDIVVRQVPSHLGQRGIRGAAIAQEGDALLILDLPKLVARARASGRFGYHPPVIMPPVDPRQEEYLLIVDDSPSIRQSLAATLTQAGYSVAVARDGVEAVEKMLQARPRLIILDIEMPKLNGYELLEMLRTHAPFATLRVIMLTAQAGARHREHALALGAVGYLVKPCVSADLLHAVADALATTSPSPTEGEKGT